MGNRELQRQEGTMADRWAPFTDEELSVIQLAFGELPGRMNTDLSDALHDEIYEEQERRALVDEARRVTSDG
jgi:hypothetical protein